MKARAHGDDGAALVLALAFILVVALGLTGLLTLADTGQRTTVAVRAQGQALYSANGGIDQAVTTVRADPAAGRHTGPCPTVSTTLNAVATEVRCEGAPGSGAVSGGSANSSNTPANAVLTLAPQGGETGLVQESNNELRIGGRVVSNSGVRVDVSSSRLVVDGELHARDACTGDITATPTLACDQGSAAIADSSDPGYSMHPDATPGVIPADAPPPAGCAASLPSGSPRFVRFSPGTYRSATALNAVFTRCSGGVFHFEPGFYYFAFTDSTPVWSVTGSPDTRIVGGVPARWTPSAPAPGDAPPAVPFPADEVPATGATPAAPAVPGGCVTSEESATTPGVQFAFSGASRWRVQDAKVELCARGSTTQQQIAVYGLPPAQATTVTPAPAPAPTTITYTGSGTSTGGSPTFDDHPNAISPGGGFAEARATSNSGSTATLTVSGLTGPAIPAGSTIDAVRLRIVHHPVQVDVSGLTATLFTAGGTQIATVGSAAGSCSAPTTNAICRKGSSAPYDQRVLLSGAFTPAALDGARLRLDALLKAGGTDERERVDALALEVTYTPAAPPPAGEPYSALSGCNVLPLASGGCPLVETVGGPTQLAMHGSFYAPSGALRLELTSVSGQVISRGAIARAIRLKVTGSSTFTGSPIRLPAAAGTVADRRVVFIARQQGVDVLRAEVTFDDNGSDSPDKRADVVSWSSLR